jgi:hypothetical protein
MHHLHIMLHTELPTTQLIAMMGCKSLTEILPRLAVAILDNWEAVLSKKR